MSTLQAIREILEQSLDLGGRASEFNESTPLLGHVAELDSMAVVTVLTQIEEYFDIEIADDDISAETFESVGALCTFVEKKTAA